MSAPLNLPVCKQSDLVSAYVLGTLQSGERLAFEAHLASCPECQSELNALQTVVDSFVHWPTDVLRPSASLWDRLADRIAGQRPSEPAAPKLQQSEPEPEWEDVAPGISCKLLATDSERHRVSMLVRLAPGGRYPAHTHAGEEELHLLDGELWIDDRKLHPGDYNYAKPGTGDRHVWSETGCTCVLITSTRDLLTSTDALR